MTNDDKNGCLFLWVYGFVCVLIGLLIGYFIFN